MEYDPPQEIRNRLEEGRFTDLLPSSKGEKTVVLLSGGIDSTVLLYLAKDAGLEAVGLEFSYEGRPPVEGKRIEEIVRGINVAHYRIDYPLAFSQNTASNGTIKLSESNSLYYSLAGAFAYKIGADFILSGQILNDWISSYDSRAMPEHYERINNLLQGEYTRRPPKVISPFIHLNKREVVKIGKSLGVPLELTWSCPKKSDDPCNTCVQCREREDAFQVNGIN